MLHVYRPFSCNTGMPYNSTVHIMVGKRFLKMAVDCVDSLLCGKQLSDSEVESLKASLASKKVQDL